METENLVQPKIKKIRGTTHPYVGLEQAIGLVDQLRKAVGRGPFNREGASKGLNHQSLSGPAMGKIAALVHFGLLSRDGNTYSVAHLADRILLPTSNEDRLSAIVEAAKKPKLYKQLVDKYQSQSLPSLLDNILAREFGINEKRAKEVSNNFRKSLEYAGLLKNGIVLEKVVQDSQQIQTDEDSNLPIDVSSNQEVDSVVPVSQSGNSRHDYSLRPSKKIFISYPSDFTLEEAKSIKSFADYLISMRSGDKT